MNPHNTSHGVRKATFYNDSAIYPEEITSGIEKVFFSFHAQAAIKTDGSVITWGHSIMVVIYVIVHMVLEI